MNSNSKEMKRIIDAFKKPLRLNENVNIQYRDYLLNKAKEIENKGEYLNCQSFSQRMLDYINKKDLKKINKNILLNKDKIKNIDILEVGDLLEFGNISHYSIYIGDGNVIEIEQWGDKPRIIPLINVLKEYEGTTSIYRK